jgi:hypothetical protein
MHLLPVSEVIIESSFFDNTVSIRDLGYRKLPLTLLFFHYIQSEPVVESS